VRYAGVLDWRLRPLALRFLPLAIELQVGALAAVDANAGLWCGQLQATIPFSHFKISARSPGNAVVKCSDAASGDAKKSPAKYRTCIVSWRLLRSIWKSVNGVSGRLPQRLIRAIFLRARKACPSRTISRATGMSRSAFATPRPSRRMSFVAGCSGDAGSQDGKAISDFANAARAFRNMRTGLSSGTRYESPAAVPITER